MATKTDDQKTDKQKSFADAFFEQLKAAFKDWWMNNKSTVVDIVKDFVNKVIDIFKTLLSKK